MPKKIIMIKKNNQIIAKSDGGPTVCTACEWEDPRAPIGFLAKEDPRFILKNKPSPTEDPRFALLASGRTHELP